MTIKFDKHDGFSPYTWIRHVEYGTNRSSEYSERPSYFSRIKTKEWRRGSERLDLFAKFPSIVLVNKSNGITDILDGNSGYRMCSKFFNWAYKNDVDPLDVSDEEMLMYIMETQ